MHSQSILKLGDGKTFLLVTVKPMEARTSRNADEACTQLYVLYQTQNAHCMAVLKASTCFLN